MMIERRLGERLARHLGLSPAVGLLGARQVGKTTLARWLRDRDVVDKPIVYLDLENPVDRAKLDDPIAYLGSQGGALTILDEVQRAPGLFEVLRGISSATSLSSGRGCRPRPCVACGRCSRTARGG